MNSWTEDRTDKLKFLWVKQLSLSEIARKLNEDGGPRVSRNAVSSKVFRLGLENRKPSTPSLARRFSPTKPETWG